jgi:quercetin dioxygenase-like cupin family protein
MATSGGVGAVAGLWRFTIKKETKGRKADHFESLKKGESIMRKSIQLATTVLFAALVLVFAAKTAMAQDPVKVDPKHYKVESENDQVRVLRITYGPHEKSVMHEHPASQVIYLTDVHVKFTLPGGKTQESRGKAGETSWAPAGKHLPENLSDKPLEGILVELKAKPAKVKPAETK